jgi:fumarylacetoacetase
MVGDFSDFSCSRDHVLNAGEAVLGVRELPPGFLYFPVGYGGRCSSIMPPGSGVLRPSGQFRSPSGVSFGPSRAVDFELELACVIGQPSQYGKPVEINVAEEHIFGFLLLNDWSARDIQGLEMNPLGPFAGKSFGTSISPWIITPDALAPYRVAAPSKEIMLAPYLQHSSREGSYAIEMKAAIEAQGITTDVCKSQFQWLYWTMADMIAHQTINGCPLNAGDILATGTVSGNKEGTLGCLLEITKGGKQSLKLQEGIERIYLHDGGAVRLTATAGEVGSPEYVGFGSCYGMVLGQ